MMSVAQRFTVNSREVYLYTLVIQVGACLEKFPARSYPTLKMVGSFEKKICKETKYYLCKMQKRDTNF